MFTASKAEVKKRFETLVAGDGRMIKCSGPLYVDQGIAVTPSRTMRHRGKPLTRSLSACSGSGNREIRKRLFDD